MADLFDYGGKTAAQLADEGIRTAIEHAGPEWNDRATEAFRQFALTHAEFLCEDVRVWAETKGLPHPPDKRAWGHIAREAVKNETVKVTGYAMTKVKPAHAGPRAVYRSNIFGGVTTYA
jgi:hypothetical protein